LASVPATVLSGTSGSRRLDVVPGYSGTLTAQLSGLAPEALTRYHVDAVNDSFDENTPAPGPGIVKTTVTVPAGTRLARFATLAADYGPGEDLDLFVYGPDGNLVGLSATETTDETVVLTAPAAGTYDVYVVQFAAPDSGPDQDLALHTALIGAGPAGNASISPDSRHVHVAGTVGETLRWHDLTAGRSYLGLVEYGDGTAIGATTLVTVNA
jgi:hypothetical protein